MKIVINNCFGGFSLSYKGVMKYAELCGFKLYAFVEERGKDGHLNFNKLVPYDESSEAFCIHYSKLPLSKTGKIREKGYFFARDIKRDDPNLIKVIELLKEKANGQCAELKIVEIPDGTNWQIEEYDGAEHIAEAHQTWS